MRGHRDYNSRLIYANFIYLSSDWVFVRILARYYKMELTYLGHSSFRLKGKNVSLVTDPFDPAMVGLKYPRVQADIVTVSHDHKDHNNIKAISQVEKIVDGPGEYEIQGVSIVGVKSYHDNKKGTLRGKNTVFVIEFDGLRIAHLGDLGHKLSERILGEMGTIDILLIPVGGEYTIGPSEAGEVVRSLEPKIIIPMHYNTKGLKADVFGKLENEKPFLSELGLPVENLDKLSIRKENIGEDQRVVILSKK